MVEPRGARHKTVPESIGSIPIIVLTCFFINIDMTPLNELLTHVGYK